LRKDDGGSRLRRPQFLHKLILSDPQPCDSSLRNDYRQFKTIYNSLQKSKTIYTNTLQQSTTIYNHVQPFTTIYNNLQHFATIYNHLHEFTTVYNNLRQYTNRLYPARIPRTPSQNVVINGANKRRNGITHFCLDGAKPKLKYPEWAKPTQEQPR
jgi:hypothetical protein